MQKRSQVLKDVPATGSFSASARENRVSYNTARSICDKFVTTGDCQPGARGRPDCKMQPFMADYLEAMVLVNQLYVEEMQDRLMTDLKSTKVLQEQFTPFNLMRRQAFVQWRDRRDPAKLFFGMTCTRNP